MDATTISTPATDPRDIAVIKLVAFGGRGSRKDLVDLYFLLQAGGSLESTLDVARRRSQRVDCNEYHLLKSLVYFEDAEEEPLPTMLREPSGLLSLPLTHRSG